jgi:hypothetical protein
MNALAIGSEQKSDPWGGSRFLWNGVAVLALVMWRGVSFTGPRLLRSGRLRKHNFIQETTYHPQSAIHKTGRLQ